MSTIKKSLANKLLKITTNLALVRQTGFGANQSFLNHC